MDGKLVRTTVISGIPIEIEGALSLCP
jgi:hypothetical protein